MIMTTCVALNETRDPKSNRLEVALLENNSNEKMLAIFKYNEEVGDPGVSSESLVVSNLGTVFK